MRYKYWSSSKLSHWIRNKFDLPNPKWHTMEGWAQHEEYCKEKAPFIHWLTDEFFNRVQDCIYWPKDQVEKVRTATIWKFFRTFWVFRKVLWNYRSWDYTGLLSFMETAARDMHECHKNHGHLVRSEQTAKDLKVWADILKRIREDSYTDDKEEFVRKDGSIWGGEFIRKPNALPNNKAKSFNKLVQMQRRNDLKLAAKMFERKVQSWWS